MVLFLTKTKKGWKKRTIIEIIIGVNTSNPKSKTGWDESFRLNVHVKNKITTIKEITIKNNVLMVFLGFLIDPFKIPLKNITDSIKYIKNRMEDK